jgi:hypothetical protein
VSGNEVFPIPEPEFLWVHNMVGLRMTGASMTVVEDAEGQWHREPSSAASVTFVGYVADAQPAEIDRAAARGIVLDAVALAPLSTAMQASDWLDCTTDASIPPWLQHTFIIKLVNPNLSHVRLMLTRSDYPAPYPD